MAVCRLISPKRHFFLIYSIKMSELASFFIQAQSPQVTLQKHLAQIYIKSGHSRCGMFYSCQKYCQRSKIEAGLFRDYQSLNATSLISALGLRDNFVCRVLSQTWRRLLKFVYQITWCEDRYEYCVCSVLEELNLASFIFL